MPVIDGTSWLIFILWWDCNKVTIGQFYGHGNNNTLKYTLTCNINKRFMLFWPFLNTYFNKSFLVHTFIAVSEIPQHFKRIGTYGIFWCTLISKSVKTRSIIIYTDSYKKKKNIYIVRSLKNSPNHSYRIVCANLEIFLNFFLNIH